MKWLAITLGLLLAAGPLLADPTATKALNAVRAQEGRAALVYSPRLEKAAQAHANELARTGKFSHQGVDGSSVGDRVRRAGYRWCFVGENIAWGQRDVARAIAEWKGSPGHFRTMTHRKAREFALARAPGNIWVMVVARPC